MPFRLDPDKYGEFRAKLQVTTAAWMPWQIYQACLKTGVVSNTVYVQLAVCASLAKDLDLDYDELVAALPRARTMSKHLWDPHDTTTPRNQYGPRSVLEDHGGGVVRYGMGNTNEEVS